MKDDYTYLFQLAKKATKGDWIAVGRWVENTRDDLPDIICCDGDRGSDNDSDAQQCADANFIGAANPKMVMKMIQEIRQLRKACHV